MFFVVEAGAKNYADTLLLDSLKNAFKKESIHDTSYCRLFAQIGEQQLVLRTTYWDSVVAACDVALNKDASEIIKQHLSRTKQGSLSNIGYIHLMNGDYPKALSYYAQSKTMLDYLNDKIGLSVYYNSVGFVYQRQGNVQAALENTHESLRICEQIGHKEGAATSLSNLADLYANQEEYDEAMKLLEQSLQIRTVLDERRGIAITRNNMGAIYKELNQLDLALAQYEASLKIYEDNNIFQGKAGIVSNIGSIYEEKKQLPTALSYYTLALDLDKQEGEPSGISSSLYQMGKINHRLGNDLVAKELGTQGLAIAQEVGLPELISSNAYLLSNILKNSGEFKKALEMRELYVLMRDSVKNEENQKATIRQETKYEFEKAALVAKHIMDEDLRIKNEQMSRRDNLQYSIILILLLLIFGGVMSLGFFDLSPHLAEGLIFFSFLILFEFILVLADPTVEQLSKGAPGYKLLFNALLAGGIFPVHAFFERMIQQRLVGNKK